MLVRYTTGLSLFAVPHGVYKILGETLHRIPITRHGAPSASWIFNGKIEH